MDCRSHKRVYAVHKGHGVIVEGADERNADIAGNIAVNRAEILFSGADIGDEIFHGSPLALTALVHTLGAAVGAFAEDEGGLPVGSVKRRLRRFKQDPVTFRLLLL